jgi:hypothetical protein
MKAWTGVVLLLSVSLAGCPRDWPEPFLRLRQESSCLLGRDVPRDAPDCDPSPEERASPCPGETPQPTGELPPWPPSGGMISPLPKGIVPPLETVHHGIPWCTTVYQREAH